MKISLGSVDLSDNELRAITLALRPQTRVPISRLPSPATRTAAREWVRIHGLQELQLALQDLEQLKQRLNQQASWRRGQPDLRLTRHEP